MSSNPANTRPDTRTSHTLHQGVPITPQTDVDRIGVLESGISSSPQRRFHPIEPDCVVVLRGADPERVVWASNPANLQPRTLQLGGPEESVSHPFQCALKPQVLEIGIGPETESPWLDTADCWKTGLRSAAWIRRGIGRRRLADKEAG